MLWLIVCGNYVEIFFSTNSRNLNKFDHNRKEKISLWAFLYSWCKGPLPWATSVWPWGGEQWTTDFGPNQRCWPFPFWAFPYMFFLYSFHLFQHYMSCSCFKKNKFLGEMGFRNIVIFIFVISFEGILISKFHDKMHV